MEEAALLGVFDMHIYPALAICQNRISQLWHKYCTLSVAAPLPALNMKTKGIVLRELQPPYEIRHKRHAVHWLSRKTTPIANSTHSVFPHSPHPPS